jgi:hypothetical protein
VGILEISVWAEPVQSLVLKRVDSEHESSLSGLTDAFGLR